MFFNYWYARNIAKPMDLPILSSALEHLKSQWYKEVEMNPDTVLMDKKDFAFVLVKYFMDYRLYSAYHDWGVYLCGLCCNFAPCR